MLAVFSHHKFLAATAREGLEQGEEEEEKKEQPGIIIPIV